MGLIESDSLKCVTPDMLVVGNPCASMTRFAEFDVRSVWRESVGHSEVFTGSRRTNLASGWAFSGEVTRPVLTRMSLIPSCGTGEFVREPAGEHSLKRTSNGDLADVPSTTLHAGLGESVPMRFERLT